MKVANSILHYVHKGEQRCLFCGRKHDGIIGHTIIFEANGAFVSDLIIYEHLMKTATYRRYRPCIIKDYPGYLRRLAKIFV